MSANVLPGQTKSAKGGQGDRIFQGYKNNQKNLHYYRCLKCNGVSINVKATPKSVRKSAEQLFEEFLEPFHISSAVRPLIELQLKKLFYEYNSNNIDTEKQLEKQLAAVQTQLKQLKLRFGLGQIDKETYELTNEHLNAQVLEISKEMNSGKVTISNLENLLSESLKNLENLSKIWGSSDLEGKRQMHKILFPDGIFYNAQKHQYLTRNVNKFVELVASISASCEENKNGNSQFFIENSRPVPESRLELPTFGL